MMVTFLTKHLFVVLTNKKGKKQSLQKTENIWMIILMMDNLSGKTIASTKLTTRTCTFEPILFG